MFTVTLASSLYCPTTRIVNILAERAVAEHERCFRAAGVAWFPAQGLTPAVFVTVAAVDSALVIALAVIVVATWPSPAIRVVSVLGGAAVVVVITCPFIVVLVWFGILGVEEAWGG